MNVALAADLTALHRRMAEAASLAPSAENIQPWSFRSDSTTLTICLDSKCTLPSDLNHMLSLTGIGACIENAVISAREEYAAAVVDYVLKTQDLHAGTRQHRHHWPDFRNAFSEAG